MLLGTGVHKVLESYRVPKGKRVYIEQHMEMEIDGTTLTGILDLLIPDVLEDWKTTGCYGAQQTPIKVDWVNQTNGYAYMAYKVLGVEVKEIYVNAILRDWTMSKIQSEKRYPKIPFKRLPVPVYDLDVVEEYLKGRVALHNRPDFDPCTDEERWKKETTYAIMKTGLKNAFAASYATGAFEDGKPVRSKFFSYKQAEEFINTDKKCKGVAGLSIEKRPGEDTRCKSYCPVRSICPFNRER
jgi:hypothetical protein